jgi:hypothetical protein
MNHAFKPIIDVIRQANIAAIKCDACEKPFAPDHDNLRMTKTGYEEKICDRCLQRGYGDKWGRS